MKRAKGMVIGLLFIVIGFLYACSAMGILDFSIFFPGFWTLFIIVPCFYGLFKKGEDKTGYIIGLAIGVCFLINAQGASFHIDFWPMVLAVLCLVIGAKLLFPSNKKRFGKDIRININNINREDGTRTVDIDGVHFDNTTNKSTAGFINTSAIFGGKDVRIENEIFTGAEICALFGAIEMDLRKAVITEDVYINATTIFGGIDIYLPANVRAVTDNCTAIFGDVDVNRAYANTLTMDAPRVVIQGSCVFGGIDVQ